MSSAPSHGEHSRIVGDRKPSLQRSVSRPDIVRRERGQSLDTDRASATLIRSREWSRLVLAVRIRWLLRKKLLGPAMFI
jgi:hypothetical protein